MTQQFITMTITITVKIPVPLQGEIWETGGMSESRPWTTGSTAGRGGW